jgi:hypothetical protein
MRVDLVGGADFTDCMRILLLAMALGVLAAAGCARKQAAFMPLTGSSPPAVSGGRPALPSTENHKLIITPEEGFVGKVARVNQEDHFVVVTFPVGHMPPLELRLNLYRGGLRVGEVKITGPQMDDDVDADLLTGDAAVGDEVRDK